MSLYNIRVICQTILIRNSLMTQYQKKIAFNTCLMNLKRTKQNRIFLIEIYLTNLTYLNFLKQVVKNNYVLIFRFNRFFSEKGLDNLNFSMFIGMENWWVVLKLLFYVWEHDKDLSLVIVISGSRLDSLRTIQ